VSKDKSRRDFIVVASYSMGAVGAGAALWPIINQMNPAADTLALASIEVNIGALETGQSLTVKWRGKPVFIRRRTSDEVKEARKVATENLRDPEDDALRVMKDEWLIVLGVCTHLGCVPLGQKVGDAVGDYGGWFCPCHGSHYDISGRIRKGPAPKNLEIPPYKFISDNIVKIG
tara:strand:+ start:168 stop:689 length:522 start_codon:yes stop_codon:yes gene_type:complete